MLFALQLLQNCCETVPMHLFFNALFAIAGFKKPFAPVFSTPKAMHSIKPGNSIHSLDLWQREKNRSYSVWAGSSSNDELIALGGFWCGPVYGLCKRTLKMGRAIRSAGIYYCWPVRFLHHAFDGRNILLEQ